MYVATASSDESRPDATAPAFQVGRRYDLQDRRKASIHLDEEPAVVICEPSPAFQLTAQDDQLMSEHRILRLKPALRLEWRGKDGQNETEQPDHSASLGDSIASSTRIRLSVHTGRGRRQVIWFGVTTHPTAEWIANQRTEACGWEQHPRYLIRDRD